MLSQLAVLLAACAERMETETADMGSGRPIVLRFGTAGYASEGGTTRSNINTGHDEDGRKLKVGEKFAVWFKSGSTVQSAVYTVDAFNATTLQGTAKVDASADNPQPYFLDGATNADVGAAYFPAMKPMAPATFSVKTNQSSTLSGGEANYMLSDLMYADGASASSSASTGAVLTFRHLMSMLTVNITNPTASITECCIVGGACRTIRMANPQTFTLSSQTDSLFTEADPLVIWQWADGTAHDGYGWHSSCMLPPQRIGRQTTAGTPERFLRIKHKDGQYTYFRIWPKTLASGYHYYIKLTIRPWMKGQTLTLGPWDSTGTCELTEVDQTYSDAATGLYNVNGTTFRMQKVSGGNLAQMTNFTMTGTLQDYWMAETEVTQALYKAAGFALPAVGTNGFSANFVGDNKPITSISPKAVFDLVAAVNRATADQRPAGTIFYLPTLEQWRWAFNGGIHLTNTTYSGSENLREVGWNNTTSFGNSGGYHHDVALLKPNALGIYDMSGNDGEMCLAAGANYTLYWQGGSSTYGQDNINYYKGTTTSTATNTVINQTWGPRLCMKPVSVGDLYFSDGSWGTKAEYPNKTPIGIVFHVGTSAKDQALGYFGGYVMALGEVNLGTVAWATGTAAATSVTGRTIVATTDYAGYKTLIYTDLDGLTYCRNAYDNNGKTYSGLNCINAAVNTYAGSVAAPACSSGWYLPAAGQQLQFTMAFAGALQGTYPTLWTGLGGTQSAWTYNLGVGSGTAIANAINAYVKDKLTTASASLWTDMNNEDNVDYPSSTETDDSNMMNNHYSGEMSSCAYYHSGNHAKSSAAYPYHVRPVLAF